MLTTWTTTITDDDGRDYRLATGTLPGTAIHNAPDLIMLARRMAGPSLRLELELHTDDDDNAITIRGTDFQFFAYTA